MEHMWFKTWQLYDALFVFESLHADATVQPLLEDQWAKSDSFKLFKSLWASDATTIKTTYIAKGYQSEKEINGERKKEKNAADSYSTK